MLPPACAKSGTWSAPQFLCFRLKHKPSHNSPLPRQAGDRSRIDKSEPARSRSGGVVVVCPLLGSQRIRRSRIIHLRTIEDIRKLRANVERLRFLDPESTAKAEVL